MFDQVDAAIEWGNGKVYLFRGTEYVRYDVAAQNVEPGWPKTIADEWDMQATQNIAGWTQNLGTAVNWGNGKAYFFKGSEYIRYDIAKDRAERNWPKQIRGQWEGLWDRDIDAALNYWNGKVYFFKGSEYVRYDIATDRVEQGWPKQIRDEWQGVWDRDIAAAVNWGDGKVYFFKGTRYIRYDIAADRADLGPVAIPADFADLCAGSGSPRGIAWGQRVSPAFRQRAIDICGNLEMEPSYLMAAMGFETGKTFSPSIRNPASGATGLIQFMPATATRLGTTTTELAAMTAERQLDFVEQYFTPFKSRLRTLGDVYMAILFPAAVGRAADFVVFSKPSVAYTQNAGLDKDLDGKVTKIEAEVLVRAVLAEGLKLAA